MTKAPLVLLASTTAFEGLRAGASVFRGLIDMPARDRLGPVAFAALSRATDLSTAGFTFYVIYGVGGALLTCATFAVAWRASAPRFVRALTGLSALCSIFILVFTTQAAPLMLRVGSSGDDPALLTSLLDGFAAWTYPRFACAVVSFASVLAALVGVAWRTTAVPE